MRFFLGTHMTGWLAQLNVPLFVSRRRLDRLKRPPRAIIPWSLDSGAFTELSQFGKWTITAREYVRLARRYRDEVGNLEWAAPQDWMCEPFILEKTGLTVDTHLRRTVINFIALREIAPEFPFIPVLQGFTRDDYLRCIDLYSRYRIDLTQYPTVGIGSVCRRQGMPEIATLIREIASYGIRLHAFGFKLQGVRLVGDALTSSDSMAWSFDARRLKHRWCLNGKHKSCANCYEYALYWRDRLLTGAPVRYLQEPVHAAQSESLLLPQLCPGILPTLPPCGEV